MNLSFPRLPWQNRWFGGLPIWSTYFQGFVGRFGWFQYGFPMWVNWLALGVAASVFGLILTLMSLANADRCRDVVNQNVYSNAKYFEEAGDVGGLEISIAPGRKSILLFDYEGSLADPITLPATYDKGALKVSADYTLDLTEYPSKKPTSQKHHVEVKAHVTKSALVGTVRFDSNPAERVRLRRVPYVWGCKGRL